MSPSKILFPLFLILPLWSFSLTIQGDSAKVGIENIRAANQKFIQLDECRESLDSAQAIIESMKEREGQRIKQVKDLQQTILLQDSSRKDQDKIVIKTEHALSWQKKKAIGWAALAAIFAGLWVAK